MRFAILAHFYDVESGRADLNLRGHGKDHEEFDVAIPRDAEPRRDDPSALPELLAGSSVRSAANPVSGTLRHLTSLP
jgi:hypothetical protein